MQHQQKYDPDNDSLLLVANVLSSALVDKLAPMNVKHYADLFKAAEVELSDEVTAELRVEELIFLLHLLGRLAHVMLDPQKRDYFMDASVFKVKEMISQVFESGAEANHFRDSFDALYNSRQEEYACYRFSSGSDDSKKGDLFWEHGKSVLFRVTTVNMVLLAMLERTGLRTCAALADIMKRKLSGAKAEAQ